MKVVTYEWDLPLHNEDGSAIPATGPGSLTEVRVQFGKYLDIHSGDVLEERIVLPGVLSLAFEVKQPGKYFARAFPRNTYGKEARTSKMATIDVGAV